MTPSLTPSFVRSSARVDGRTNGQTDVHLDDGRREKHSAIACKKSVRKSVCHRPNSAQQFRSQQTTDFLNIHRSRLIRAMLCPSVIETIFTSHSRKNRECTAVCVWIWIKIMLHWWFSDWIASYHAAIWRCRVVLISESITHGSVSVVRTTFKVYGKMQTLTLSQPKTPEPIVTKF